MKLKFKIDIPTDIEKLTVDDIVFRTKDGTEELTFDEFFKELIGDIDIIVKAGFNIEPCFFLSFRN